MTRRTPTTVTVRFRVAFSRAELEEAFLKAAPDIAKIHGMRWKIWAFDDATREFQSVYLFEDEASARAFEEGPVIASLHEDRDLSEIRVRRHGVLETLSRATRAPIAA